VKPLGAARPDVGIVRGFSKDRRPELVQFKLGSAVTQDGIPLFGHGIDGNASDSAWEHEALSWVKSLVDEKTRGRSCTARTRLW
jgi:transposase